MNYNRIRSFCRIFRIVAGSALIAAGFITQVYWFFLGALPLLAGIVNFCPLCLITKKCNLPQRKA